LLLLLRESFNPLLLPLLKQAVVLIREKSFSCFLAQVQFLPFNQG
jgi:hypothetical protein